MRFFNAATSIISAIKIHLADSNLYLGYHQNDKKVFFSQ